MAEEIKRINAYESEHKNSVLEELVAIRHEMDLGNTYRDGAKAKEKEMISTMYSNGLSIDDIAKYLKMDLEDVKRILSQ